MTDHLQCIGGTYDGKILPRGSVPLDVWGRVSLPVEHFDKIDVNEEIVYRRDSEEYFFATLECSLSLDEPLSNGTMKARMATNGRRFAVDVRCLGRYSFHKRLCVLLHSSVDADKFLNDTVDALLAHQLIELGIVQAECRASVAKDTIDRLRQATERLEDVGEF